MFTGPIGAISDGRCELTCAGQVISTACFIADEMRKINRQFVAFDNNNNATNTLEPNESTTEKLLSVLATETSCKSSMDCTRIAGSDYSLQYAEAREFDIEGMCVCVVFFIFQLIGVLIGRRQPVRCHQISKMVVVEAVEKEITAEDIGLEQSMLSCFGIPSQLVVLISLTYVRVS